MKQKLKPLLITSIVVAILVGSIFGYSTYTKQKLEAYVQKVGDVALQGWYDDSSYQGEGYVSNDKAQSIFVNSSNDVISCYVSQGDKVTKGQKLVTLDTSSVASSIKQKQLEIDRLSHDYENASKELARLKKFIPNDKDPYALPENIVDDQGRFIYLQKLANLRSCVIGELFEQDNIEQEVEIGSSLFRVNFNDDGNFANLRPEKIEIQLYASYVSEDEYIPFEHKDEVPIKTIVLNEDNNWSYDWINYPNTPEKLEEFFKEEDENQEDTQETVETPEEEDVENPEEGEPSQEPIEDTRKKAITAVYSKENHSSKYHKLYDRNLYNNVLDDGYVLSYELTKTLKYQVLYDEENSFVLGEFLNQIWELGHRASTIRTIEINFKKDASDNPGATIINKGLPYFLGDQARYSIPDFEETFDHIPQGEHYTTSQLTSMIFEQEKQMKQIEIQKRKANLELAQYQEQMAKGTIVANIDGIVSSLNEEPMNGSPYMTIAGSEGLFISGNISELMLEKLDVGDSVTCSSWETGMTYMAKITSIDDYPSNNYGYYGGNQNVSYYGYKAYIEDASQLYVGQYLSLQYNLENNEAQDSIILESYFVREENGNHYVYKEENGKLKKQYVKVGKKLSSGYLIEVKQGLSREDYITFPYGKNAKEGVKTTYEGSMYY